MEIIEKLKNKLPMVEAQFPYINCGGCGLFAVLLYNELKRIRLNPELIVISRSAMILSFVENNKFIESQATMHMQGVFVDHVMVKVGDYYLDAEGVHEIPWSGWEVSITHKSFKSFLRKSNRHLWNRAFNWEQAKPITMTLKEIIKESLN